MPSLSYVIDHKYGDNKPAEDELGAGTGTKEPDFVIFVRKPSRAFIPASLVLDKCEITSVGDITFLKEKCAAGVTELDVSHNQLTEWRDVGAILSVLPSLTFLNLGFNPLKTVQANEENGSLTVPDLPNLQTLILISTTVAWSRLHAILTQTPNLTELHLSKNEFKTVDVKKEGDSMSVFPQVKRLLFNCNPIQSWDQVSKLGLIFPSLEHLGLSDCGLGSVPANAHEKFPKLSSLSLMDNPLSGMEDITNLNLFPSLTELRILGTQLFLDLTDHERRQFIIALLPNVTKVNGGSTVPANEREGAERAFIRYYKELEPKPNRYLELTERHGELAPLLQLSLRPQKRVKLQIILDEVRMEHEISVYQTTSELKILLESLIGIQPSRQRLFYADSDTSGFEEMRFPQKLLYSYNMQDHDEIHVWLKE